MDQEKYCPFVDRECLKEKCVGWITEKCFIFNLLDQVNPNILSSNFMPKDIASNITLKKEDNEHNSIQSNNYSKKTINMKFRYGLDFGTAYSKIQLREISENNQSNIRLLKKNDIEPFIIPSICYISKDKIISFGSTAQDKYSSDIVENKPGYYFSSIKRVLLEGTVNQQDDDDCPIQNSFEIIVYMLAYMFNKADEALKKYYKSLNIENNSIIVKNFAVPPYKEEEKRLTSPIDVSFRDLQFTKKNYESFLKDAIVVAEYIQPLFKDREKLPFDELHNIYSKSPSFIAQNKDFIRKYCSLSKCCFEPCAVIDEIIIDEKYQDGVYGIIDVGAGTTDIFFFIKMNKNCHSLYKNSHILGGDKVDEILYELIKNKYKERSQNIENDEFLLERYYLNAEIRTIKEELMSNKNYIVEPKKGNKETKLDVVEITYHEFIECLKKKFSWRLKGKLKKDYLEVQNVIANFPLNQVPSNLRQIKTIFITGGCSKLPVVMDDLAGVFDNIDIKLLAVPDIYKAIEDYYIYLAIAIGASNPDSKSFDFMEIETPFVNQIGQADPEY